MMKTALIAGSTGLIGQHLIQLLLQENNFESVLSIVRKPTELAHPKLTEIAVDFNDLHSIRGQLKADVFFSCLGTTAAKTPDKQQYFKIEHDYPLQLAQIACQQGATQFHYVSSMGANENATNVYLKNKGIAEADLKKVGLESLYIYRPSMLMGERKEKRPVEKWMAHIMKVLSFAISANYQPVAAKDVAACMYKEAQKSRKGIYTILSGEIKSGT